MANMGRLLLRVTVGVFFIGHGTQKLFGWFGGRGLDATAEGFEKHGLRPGKANALVAGSAEAGGGALLVAGLATPLATSILVATMLTAIKRVHLKNGPWNGNGGYEYNAVLIAALATIAEAGPGPFSIDEAHDRGHAGGHHALRTLGIGVLGAAAAHFSAEHWPAAEATTAAAEVAPAAAEPQPAG